jgi:hypothetical protein
VRTSRSYVAWASLAAGVASVATLPVAVYVTRFSDAYELVHSGFAIPIGAALGLLSMRLAGRAARRSALALGRSGGVGMARIGRVLGMVGICLALAGVVALAVFALLEYAGTRD